MPHRNTRNVVELKHTTSDGTAAGKEIFFWRKKEEPAPTFEDAVKELGVSLHAMNARRLRLQPAH